MKFSSLKGRIALRLLQLHLIAFLLSMGIFDILRHASMPVAFALSILFFSLFVTLSAYIVCAMELWAFKKLAETGRKPGGNHEAQAASEDMPEEVREVQERLEDLRKRMDDALLSQKRFLADASHEMRSPITIMKGNIEITLRRERDPEEYRGVLNSNLEEIDRLERLVKDLMFLARADSSELLVNLAPMRLDEVMEQTCRGLATLASVKGVSLEFDAHNYGEESVISGDRDRLLQLFINLVENSLRYTPRGGSVKVDLVRVAGVNKASVTDTGIGIPEAELDRIFDRFYRVDKARSREAGGTGLGLCISKWIVEAHKGEISIESKEGAGTKVTVMFV